jgi:mono/diheme cytochrome c family protein
MPPPMDMSWGIRAQMQYQAQGDAAARSAALKTFKEEVAPFIATHCTRCHGEKKKKAGVTFEYAVKNPGSPAFRTLWEHASQITKSHDMPPEKEEKQPTEQERAMLVAWVKDIKYLSAKDPGAFVIRRLNKREYGNTLHDLLGVDPQIAGDLPEEVFGAGYANSISPLLMERYLGIANDVLARVIAPAGAPPTAVQQQVFGDLPTAPAQEPAAAERVARGFARRAYRRPPTDGEIGVLLKVYALARDKGRSYQESIRLLMKAVLVSPQFLYITPDGPVAADRDIVPLDDHQLAARLSYFLWSTMPDAELSAAADAGRLRDPAVLAAQTRRLLADQRSRALFDGFGAQWLGVDKLAGKTFDEARFPQMTPALRAAMYDEARLFFDSVLREDRGLLAFIDADYTFVNETLAGHYGLQASGAEMRRVVLSDANRGGVLTMPGVLAMSSFPNRTSPVNRGVWVLEQVLGEHVPPPPADVPALEKQDRKKVENLTLRQRTELHRTDPVCASCHQVLDPIGFGLENFDAIGRWRDQDDTGGAIDATGELPGGKRFSAPKELKRIIAARTDDLCRSLTGKMLAYALCRQLEGYDEVVVDRLAASLAPDGHRLQALVVAVTTSYPFTHRRISETTGKSHAK